MAKSYHYGSCTSTHDDHHIDICISWCYCCSLTQALHSLDLLQSIKGKKKQGGFFNNIYRLVNIKRVLFGGYLTLYLEKEQTHHLENVISWFDVSDIHPLAVDVVSVGIPAAHGDALLSKVSALIPLFNTCSRTLQNEKRDGNQTLWERLLRFKSHIIDFSKSLMFLYTQLIWD